jgi:hypothetical protein
MFLLPEVAQADQAQAAPLRATVAQWDPPLGRALAIRDLPMQMGWEMERPEIILDLSPEQWERIRMQIPATPHQETEMLLQMTPVQTRVTLEQAGLLVRWETPAIQQLVTANNPRALIKKKAPYSELKRSLFLITRPCKPIQSDRPVEKDSLSSTKSI